MEALISNTTIESPNAVAWTNPTQPHRNSPFSFGEYHFLLTACATVLEYGTGTFFSGVRSLRSC